MKNKSMLWLSLFLLVGCTAQEPSTGGTTADNPELSLGDDDVFDIFYDSLPMKGSLRLCESKLYLLNHFNDSYVIPFSTPREVVITYTEFLAAQTQLFSPRVVAASAEVVKGCGPSPEYSVAFRKSDGTVVLTQAEFQLKWFPVEVNYVDHKITISFPEDFNPSLINTPQDLETALKRQ